MSKFSIEKTPDQRIIEDDYIVVVHPSVKKEKHLGKFAVLVLNHPKIDKKIKVPCRVVVDQKREDENNEKHKDAIKADQTLRNSIGIPKDEEEKFTVEIYPLRLSPFQKLRYCISSILGRRYQFFRVCKADIPDIEKNICRIPSDTFELLGCEEGDRVICESVVDDKNRENNLNFYRLREHKIRCYGASKEMIKKRKEMEEGDISARYPSAEKLLGVIPDIPRIFLDAHARDMLKVNDLEPVRVRRDLFHLFLKQIREFGIIFLLSLLAIRDILPINTAWQFIISVAIAFLLILMNIRAKIK